VLCCRAHNGFSQQQPNRFPPVSILFLFQQLKVQRCLYVEATVFSQLQCTTIAIHPYDATKVVDIVTNAVLTVGDFGDAIYLGVGVTNQYLSIQKLAGIDEPGLYYMNPSSGATSLVARGENKCR
jgi:hypothetical protein